MSRNMYIYDKFDIRIKRNIYQYSKYNKKKFINSYFLSRKKFLKKYKLENKNYFSNINTKFTKRKILFICRNFELKKELYLNNKKKPFTLRNYIKISEVISEFLIRNFDYSILSTLLKINDLIAYLANKKKTVIEKQLSKIFYLEKYLIKKLINEKNI